MLLSLSFSSETADMPPLLLLDPPATTIGLELTDCIADFSLSLNDGAVRGDVAGSDVEGSRFSEAGNDGAAGLAAEEGPLERMCETSRVKALGAGDGKESVMAIPLVPGTESAIAPELGTLESDVAGGFAVAILRTAPSSAAEWSLTGLVPCSCEEDPLLLSIFDIFRNESDPINSIIFTESK